MRKGGQHLDLLTNNLERGTRLQCPPSNIILFVSNQDVLYQPHKCTKTKISLTQSSHLSQPSSIFIKGGIPGWERSSEVARVIPPATFHSPVLCYNCYEIKYFLSCKRVLNNFARHNATFPFLYSVCTVEL